MQILDALTGIEIQKGSIVNIQFLIKNNMDYMSSVKKEYLPITFPIECKYIGDGRFELISEKPEYSVAAFQRDFSLQNFFEHVHIQKFDQISEYKIMITEQFIEDFVLGTIYPNSKHGLQVAFERNAAMFDYIKREKSSNPEYKVHLKSLLDNSFGEDLINQYLIESYLYGVEETLNTDFSEETLMGLIDRGFLVSLSYLSMFEHTLEKLGMKYTPSIINEKPLLQNELKIKFNKYLNKKMKGELNV